MSTGGAACSESLAPSSPSPTLWSWCRHCPRGPTLRTTHSFQQFQGKQLFLMTWHAQPDRHGCSDWSAGVTALLAHSPGCGGGAAPGPGTRATDRARKASGVEDAHSTTVSCQRNFLIGCSSFNLASKLLPYREVGTNLKLSNILI